MIQIDAVGQACPIPVVRAKKTIEALQSPDQVEVFVDNEIAVQNLTKMANQKGYAVSSEQVEKFRYRVLFTIEEGMLKKTEDDRETQEEIPSCEVSKKSSTVVVFSSNCMGTGDDQLGAALMKAFVYALSQQEELPKTLLFYNGGAKLTTDEKLPLLEDLKYMESQGVEIITCGTCLDFYGLKDKLQVGEVSNMYVIVEKMTNADKVIRP